MKLVNVDGKTLLLAEDENGKVYQVGEAKELDEMKDSEKLYKAYYSQK